MEWVVTTGRTVEEAKDRALDELGVDELEAEFEVLEEPKAGLFGRVRREAKVRARVTPRQPRPKVDRRERGRRGRGNGQGGQRGGDRGRGNGQAKPRANGQSKESGGDATEAPAGGNAKQQGGGKGGGRRRASDETTDAGSTAGATAARATAERPAPVEHAAPKDDERDEKGSAMTVSAQEQAEAAKEFLEGLLDEFGSEGSVNLETIDEDTVELRVEGPDLGLLIGPKGQTLNAVQELARTYAMRTLPGQHEGRIRVDVSGYREKRREALERFTRQVAEEVRSSGVAKSLEPMHPADRKVVHDTVNELEGVRTISEGDEPRRRVVILPEGD